MTLVTQFDVIQLRRGPEADLPGAPNVGNPNVPTTGLDPGEPAFATDVGRIFIGTDPAQTGPWTGRAAFPYENVEVLTEYSSDVLASNFDSSFRSTTTGYIPSVPIAICDSANAADWRPLQVISAGTTTDFAISTGSNVGAAQVFYFIFDNNNNPVKTGKMMIWYGNNAIAPKLSDDGITFARSDLTGSSANDPNSVYGSLQFRALSAASGQTTQIIIQYRNLMTSILTMLFRIERATP